jgi:hypothetical protein
MTLMDFSRKHSPVDSSFSRFLPVMEVVSAGKGIKQNMFARD